MIPVNSPQVKPVLPRHKQDAYWKIGGCAVFSAYVIKRGFFYTQIKAHAKLSSLKSL